MYPQLQDTGGFFITVFEKVAEIKGAANGKDAKKAAAAAGAATKSAPAAPPAASAPRDYSATRTVYAQPLHVLHDCHPAVATRRSTRSCAGWTLVQPTRSCALVRRWAVPACSHHLCALWRVPSCRYGPTAIQASKKAAAKPPPGPDVNYKAVQKLNKGANGFKEDPYYFRDDIEDDFWTEVQVCVPTAVCWRPVRVRRWIPLPHGVCVLALRL